MAAATCRHARRVCRRTGSSTLRSILTGRSITPQLGFFLFTRHLRSAIEGIPCRGIPLAVTVNRDSRRREAVNDMTQMSDKTTPSTGLSNILKMLSLTMVERGPLDQRFLPPKAERMPPGSISQFNLFALYGGTTDGVL